MIPIDMKLTDIYKTNEANAKKALEYDAVKKEAESQKILDGTKAIATEAYKTGVQEAVNKLLGQLQQHTPHTTGLANRYAHESYDDPYGNSASVVQHNDLDMYR